MRKIVLAAILAISPLTAALAQGTTGPGLKADSTTESKAVKDGSNPNQAGATGSKVVPGNKSTVASDHKSTTEMKAGAASGDGK